MSAPSGAILRPAKPGDGDEIWALLAPAADEVLGMSSLPGSGATAKQACEDTASTIADLATGSFSVDDGEQRRVLFVLTEDPSGQDGGAILGLTGVTFKRAVPNLAVKVTTSVDGQGLLMSSSSLPWTRTELDSSFIGPAARGRRLGTLLSRGRFTLLHLVSSQVPNTVASHLRGRFNQDGSAPFWTAFGARFAEWASSTDAERALLDDPERLAELAGHRLPLTAAVLASLGPVNEASLPAYHLLSAEGLRPNGMYDPIDGGPTVVAELSETVTGRLRRHGRARIGETGAIDALVSVTDIDNFRVTRAMVTTAASAQITIDRETAERLGVDDNALLVAAPLESAAERPVDRSLFPDLADGAPR